MYNLLKRNLVPSDAGKTFFTRLEETFCVGKIQHEDGIFFLCQDILSGNECRNKLGHQCSWQVSSSFPGSYKVILLEMPDNGWDREDNLQIDKIRKAVM